MLDCLSQGYMYKVRYSGEADVRQNITEEEMGWERNERYENKEAGHCDRTITAIHFPVEQCPIQAAVVRLAFAAMSALSSWRGCQLGRAMPDFHFSCAGSKISSRYIMTLETNLGQSKDLSIWSCFH